MSDQVREAAERLARAAKNRVEASKPKVLDKGWVLRVDRYTFVDTFRRTRREALKARWPPERGENPWITDLRTSEKVEAVKVRLVEGW